MDSIQHFSNTKKVNLLHLVQTLGLGGAEMMLIQYILSLGNDRYNHHVFCIGHDGPNRAKLEALGLNVIFCKKRSSITNPISFIMSLITIVKQLYKFIKYNKIQIIFSHLSHANKLAILLGLITNVPSFPTCHNTNEFVDRRSKFDPRVYINKIVDWILYPFADTIIAVSNEIKKIIEKNFSVFKPNVLVIKNGLYFDKHTYQSPKTESNAQNNPKTFRIISVGRLQYQKAMEVLIKSTPELLNKGIKNFKILIIGDGEEKRKLQDLIVELNISDYISLLGYRTDVFDFLISSDIYVISSRFEGLSIAMIEAMSCGLPIIASDAPGLRTFIKHGINGLLFPIEDHQSLAENICKLISDDILRNNISLNSRESFLKEYDMIENIKPLDNYFQRYAVSNLKST